MLWTLRTLLRKNWKLKRKAPGSLVLEFALPLVFVVLFAALKNITSVAQVRPGWSRENVGSCAFEYPEDPSELTCTLPYAPFIRDVTSFDLMANNFRGRWAGHETAKIFLATSTGDQREIDALQQFVTWVAEVGTAEGTQSDFADLVFVLGNGTVSELEDYVRSGSYGNPEFTAENPECGLAIVFDEMDFDNAHFAYTLRLNSTNSAPLFEVPRTTLDATYNTEQAMLWTNAAENPEYITSGFITFQRVLDSWIISTAGNVSSYDDVWQPFAATFLPFPVFEHTFDEFFFYTAEVFPLVFTLAYLYPVALILEGLVRERETRVAEMLKIMGVSESWIVFSWFITYAIIFGILSIIITALCSNMLPNTSSNRGGPLVLWILFFFYGMAIMSLCYAMSTAFWHARTASYVGVVLYFIGFFLYYAVSSEELDPKPFLPLLFPQVSFSLTLQVIASLEASTIGVSSNTLREPIAGFTVSAGISMLFFDIFFWAAVGSYLSAVLPRQFGQRRSVIFFLKPSYWAGWIRWLIDSRAAALAAAAGSDDNDQGFTGKKSLPPLQFPPELAENVEVRAATGGMRRPRVQIRDLRKVFSTPSGPKIAVDGLSLDMYEGEILALLGHNGAGKTTTLQILSGMLPFNGGEALVGGASISSNMDQVRRSLGFCPQHDVLYPSLTVKEHLWFYGRIKGLSGASLAEAISSSVAHVGLTEKLNVRSSALSGGMKRKLSVAIALLGDSKVVFVDEPTSGVDPWSRRSIWQVLQDAREGRVIVLTTHFMDEADLLGDQIAIMAEGKLKCLGSSLFLKRRFGAGYLLTMVKRPEEDPAADAANVERICAVVNKHVPDATLSSNVGTEVSFQLPTAAVGRFAAMFKEIDNSSLPIDQYGVSVTTLEEVFLQVARADDQHRAYRDTKPDTPVPTASEVDPDPAAPAALDKTAATSLRIDAVQAELAPARTLDEAPLPSMRIQFAALFMKRARFARRDFRSFCCSVLMPVVLFAAGLTVLKLVPIGNDDPLYTLSPEDWNPNLQDTAGAKAAAMPVMEFDVNGSMASRVMQSDNLPAWGLETRVLEPYPEDEVVTIFDRDYINGLPTSEMCAVVDCSDLPSALHGSGVLNLAEAMIKEPIDRSGASLYAAAILQPMRAEVEYSCLVADFEGDVDGLVTSYTSEVCSKEGSACAYIEMEFQGVRTCIPVGCYSNLIESDAISQVITSGSAFGVTVATGSSQEDIDAELAALVESTLVITCEGALCNTGPASPFDPSVCRASEEDFCIPDNLIAYKVDSETYDLYEASGTEVEYCDETRGGGSGGTSGGVSVSPTAAPTASGLPPTGYCYSSGIGALLAETLLTIISDFIIPANGTGAVGNATGIFEGSVDFDLISLTNASDPQDVACVDDLLPCSFVALEPVLAGAPQICIFDSCVDDPDVYMASISEAIPGFNESLANGTRYDCNYTASVCDTPVDIVQLDAIVKAQLDVDAINATLGDLFNVTLPAGALDGLNVTALLEDNPEVVAALLGALADPASANLTAIVEDLLPEGTTLPEGFNITELLEDPEVQAALTAVVQEVYEVENEVVECTDPNDVCLLSQVGFVAGSLCAPVGCKSDFAQVTYAYVPALGGVTSFEDVALFECNTTLCNDGCRAGGNCEAEDLEPLQYNATEDSFSNGTMQWCPPAPWRFGYTALVNSTARHGAPIVANAIHNALLRQKAKELGLPASDPYIRASTQPLPITASLQTIISGIVAFTAAIFALIAFAFVPASVASYVVQEREATANIKLSQLISGAGIVPYWLSLFTFDLLNFLVPLAGALGLIMLFDIRTYMDNGVFGAVFLLILGYGLSAIPFAYLTSNLFKTHTTALIMTLFINLITGLVLMIASFVMETLDNEPVNNANASLKGFYRIFPGYCLGDALIQLSIIKVLSGFVGPSYVLPSPYDDDIAGASLKYLYSQAIVFSLAVLCIEYLSAYPDLRSRLPTFSASRVRAVLKRLRPGRVNVGAPASIHSPEDEDVVREAARVNAGEADGEAVVLKGLCKVYDSGKIAVRGLSLGISEGETFGLLGVNGAGKTTTLKMLTGELTATSGSAKIGGFRIATQPREARRIIGYCPQFDALLDLLTVREHLQLFGRIKGLRGASLEASIARLLRTLTLEPFEHKLARGLSGGTKRKLSLAIALIGSPRVIFLDEPTTGVDAISKRFIWDVLDDVREGLLGHKSTLVLTSHSMEEIEALSTRLGIMVGGRFRCLGSAQHLKNRFGEGLLLEATLEAPSTEARDALVEKSGLPDRLSLGDIEDGALDGLDEPERVNLILGRDDSAWALCHHLDEYGEVTSEALAEWWLVEEANARVFDALSGRFPGATIVERHDLSLRYSIPERGIAAVFDFIETSKSSLHIEEYAVSQVSLESIFNLFASQQEEEVGVARGFNVQVDPGDDRAL